MNAAAQKNNRYQASKAERFTAFTKGLAQLSKKYGVVLQVTGGVEIYDETIERIEYDDDWTSGDMSPVELDTNF